MQIQETAERRKGKANKLMGAGRAKLSSMGDLSWGGDGEKEGEAKVEDVGVLLSGGREISC
ncbi:hypothetical protein Dda_7672 [Drechslerella dactyloides]|uniref:Uncharacterized protein n=1 Tax=Drechslerella dactyloides TaxID=74499 RepID=A0AAD6ISK9_DREDA|nr:hypothetical protein Dda_7672 [Drechslerella dactyloides]